MSVTRSQYWSCSKFADWIRGTEKSGAKTSEGWRQWSKEAKHSYPIRYWIAEELLDKIQDTLMYPMDKLYDFKYYLKNRFIDKTHALTSNLEQGVYHDLDTRIINCLFDELVNYVEVDLAWSNVAWDLDSRKKYKPPFYAFGWLRSGTWRSPEAGIEYLEWASKLTNSEFLDESEKDKAVPTQQAISAAETLVLYNWWKNVRPNRGDPYDISGWTEIYEEKRRAKDADDILSIFDISEENTELRERSKKAANMLNEIEKSYSDEDEEMLIRLIRIRKSLWI
jgi:hypothetical protein